MTAPGARRADRDRDPAGRARSARPRDASGRPLPPGAAGVERVDEDVVLAPADALAEAQRLLDGGYPFHAHEVLEGAWKSGPDDERPFWKGLAQLAVGLTHEQRGNRRGAVSLLRRGADTVTGGAAAAARYGTDPTRLAGWARARADAVAAGEELGAGGPPQLRG
jgi:predicted metal-dependent hydrolase